MSGDQDGRLDLRKDLGKSGHSGKSDMKKDTSDESVRGSDDETKDAKEVIRKLQAENAVLKANTSKVAIPANEKDLTDIRKKTEQYVLRLERLMGLGYADKPKHEIAAQDAHKMIVHYVGVRATEQAASERLRVIFNAVSRNLHLARDLVNSCTTQRKLINHTGGPDILQDVKRQKEAIKAAVDTHEAGHNETAKNAAP